MIKSRALPIDVDRERAEPGAIASNYRNSRSLRSSRGDFLIRVRIKATADARTRGLEIQGHAGLEQAGQDIVCAAVSVLAENLAASLRNLLKLPVQVRSQHGDFLLELREADLSYETDLLFASVLLGLKSIAGGYPDRVEIVEA